MASVSGLSEFAITPTHIQIGNYSVQTGKIYDFWLIPDQPRCVRLYTTGAMGHEKNVMLDIELSTAEKVNEFMQQLLKIQKSSFILGVNRIEPTVEQVKEGGWSARISWKLVKGSAKAFREIIQPAFFPQFTWKDATKTSLATLTMIRPNREGAIQAIKDALEPCLAQMHDEGYKALRITHSEFETLKKKTDLPKTASEQSTIPLYHFSDRGLMPKKIIAYPF